MIIEALELGPLMTNCYVVGCPETLEAMIVDPGGNGEVIAALRRHDLKPVKLLNTHGHADHIAGNGRLKQRFPDARLCIHREDAPMLGDPQQNLSAPFGVSLTSPRADRLLEDGDAIDEAGLHFDVIHIPGHAPGHVVFVLPTEPALVFDGDVLFADSVGRTDLPRGSHEQLVTGIRQKLLTMPPDTRICPGHGPPTTVGRESRLNPYVSDDVV